MPSDSQGSGNQLPGADGMTPEDLSHAGSVVDKAVEYMTGQNIAPISIASALLGGALDLMSRSMEDRAILRVLRSAVDSVESGELRAMQQPRPS
ncbi:hypothetical protein [Roseomonas sp. BN140053]|uniref:hypothetical protein n=1 Tax=Roseomonas sp. BN140053 TaxID=3391898 RepID=UPI0039EBDACB